MTNRHKMRRTVMRFGYVYDRKKKLWCVGVIGGLDRVYRNLSDTYLELQKSRALFLAMERGECFLSAINSVNN